MGEELRRSHSTPTSMRSATIIVRLAAMVTEALPRGDPGAARCRPGRGSASSSRATTCSTNCRCKSRKRCYRLMATCSNRWPSDLRADHRRGQAQRRVRAIRRPGCQHLQGAAPHVRRASSIPVLARPHLPDERRGAAPHPHEPSRAYAEGDAGVAAALDDIDDRLDELQGGVHPGRVRVARTPIDAKEAVQLALIARYYERIGDHAVNVGERVRFMVTGWLPGAHRRGARRGRARPSRDCRVSASRVPVRPSDGTVADDE